MNQANLSNSRFSKHDIYALVVIFLFVAFMLHLSWLKWLHPIIDCGREVYIPWQLLNGKILYRDLACYYGPFAPYITALWLKLFGLHLNVLYAINFIINLIIYFLLYYLSRQLLNQIFSVLTLMIFIEIASLAPSLGSYEGYIFPYSFSALYGLLFFLLQLAFIILYIKHSDKKYYLYLSAFFASLGISCKQDVALSVLVLTLAFSIYLFVTKNRSLKLYWLTTLVFPIIAYGIFFLFLPAEFYIKRYMLPSYVAFSDYGTTTLVPFFTFKHFELTIENLINTLLLFLVLTLVLFIIIKLYYTFIFNTILKKSKLIAITLTLLIIILLFNEVLNYLILKNQIIEKTFVIIKLISWIPSFIFVFLFVKLATLIRSKENVSQKELLFIIIATASVALNFRCFIYCFTTYLIAPSLITIMYLFAERLPFFICKTNINNYKITQYAIIASITIFILIYGVKNYAIFKKQNYLVKTSQGSFKTFKAYAEGYNSVIYFINNYTKTGDFVTIFPEETLINFLTLRSTPTTVTQFMDINNIMMTKEERVKNFKELSETNYILISNFPYLMEKKYYFGINYHKDIAKWIKQNYELIAEAGKYEVYLNKSPTNYGFLIFKRKE